MRRSRGGLRLASNSHCTSACPEQHHLCILKPMMALGARHTGSTVPFTSAGSAHQQHRRASRLRSPMPPQALFGLLAKPEQRTASKQQLLEVIRPLQRGAAASPEDQQRVEDAVRALERQNPNKSSLAAPEINGKWELIYTTSGSILGTSRPPFLRPIGRIFQFIDAENLKAANKESFPFFNQVLADLTPETKSRVAVKFTQFRIFGLIPITAPDSARGTLDTTYVDDTLRVSRGDKGNLFILEQRDPAGRP